MIKSGISRKKVVEFFRKSHPEKGSFKTWENKSKKWEETMPK